MKVNLNRYKNVGKVIGKRYIERPNGTHGEVNSTKFRFVYANLNQSISSKINNLGNNETSKKLIVSMDPRFESYLNDTGADQIELGTMDYKISNVSKDDSQTMVVYQITIDNQAGSDNNNNNNNSNPYDNNDNYGGGGW